MVGNRMLGSDEKRVKCNDPPNFTIKTQVLSRIQNKIKFELCYVMINFE